MQSLTSRSTLWLYIATVLVLSGQTLATAWRTETGMSTLRSQWRDTVCALFGLRSRPLVSRSPSRRTDFFLKQSTRVERLFPQNAAKAAGGAFMLCSPTRGYSTSSISAANSEATADGVIMEHVNIGWPTDSADPTVEQRVLELTKLAAQLEPDNIAWWQLRAMLLIPPSSHALDSMPRDPNWETTLNECIQHDPNNALYDFLLAHFYWTSNAQREYSPRQGILNYRVVPSGQKFEKGTSYFERGLQKPTSEFRLGALHAAANEFLGASSVPINQHPMLIETQLWRNRHTSLLGILGSWQELRAMDASNRGEPAEAIKCYEQTLHMIDQFGNSSATARYDHSASSQRELAANRIKLIATEQSQKFTQAELAEFEEQEVAIRWGRWIAGTAVGTYARQVGTQENRGRRIAPFGLTREQGALAFYLLPTCVLLPLLIAGCAWLTIQVTRDPNAPSLQPLAAPHASRVLIVTLLFAISLGFTYVTFGMAPAGFIARDLQALIITLVLIIAPVVSAVWLLSKLLIQKELRFSLRKVMAMMFACCMLCALVASNGLGLDAFKSLPFRLWIPAMEGRGIRQFTLLSTRLPADRSMMFKWYLAVCQWAAYYGHIQTILIWGGLLSIIKSSSSRNNLASLNQNEVPKGTTVQARLRFFLAPIVRPFIALSAVSLIAYLLLAPGILKSIEGRYQNHLAKVLKPDAFWSKVHQQAESLRELHPLEDFPIQQFSPLPAEHLKRQLESMRSKP